MRPWFDSWGGKIPWRRERLPTPVFWPGEFSVISLIYILPYLFCQCIFVFCFHTHNNILYSLFCNLLSSLIVCLRCHSITVNMVLPHPFQYLWATDGQSLSNYPYWWIFRLFPTYYHYEQGYNEHHCTQLMYIRVNSFRQCFSNLPVSCKINYVVTRILFNKIKQNIIT